MGRFYCVKDGLQYAWTKFREGNLVKWAVIYNVSTLLASILDVVLFAIVFMLVLGWTMEQSMEMNIPLISLIVGLWVFPRFLLAAMRTAQLKTVDRAPSIIDWAHLSIRKMIVNVFCWYDKKLLAPAVFLMSLSLIILGAGAFLNEPSIAGGVLVITGGLSLLLWGIAIAIHSIRTNFADYMYLRAEGKLEKMPRRSHDLVQGQTFEVFLAQFLFGIALILILGVAVLLIIALSFIPCAGIIIGMILIIAMLIGITAFEGEFMSDLFRFFADGQKEKNVLNKNKAKASDRKKRKTTKNRVRKRRK